MRALLVTAIVLCLDCHADARAPISYAGRPPTTHTPGRCWCKWHGPRGGCVQWVCRHRE